MRTFPRLKLGQYLAIGYYDLPFRIFFSLLTAKLFLFTHLTCLRIESFIPVFGAMLLLLAPSLLIPRRGLQLVYLIILDLIFSFVFFAQTLYFSYFCDFALVSQLGQVHQLKAIFHLLLSRTRLEYLFVADLIMLPLLPILSRSAEGRTMTDRGKAVAVYVLVGIICNVNAASFQAQSRYSYFKSFCDRHSYVRCMGIVNYQTCDICSCLLYSKMHKIAITQSDVDTVMKWHNEHSATGHANDLTGIAKGLNLIVIQVESLQNFVIGRRYDGREITPTLNKLARNGIYFSNIFDQTGDGHSSDATFLANCSLYPSRQGAVAYLYPQNRFDSLPALLKDAGYATAALHAYRGSFWNRRVFDRTMGFDHQFYEESYSMDEILGWGLSDRSFFTQSLPKLEGIHEPFYALMTTLTSHDPFDAVSDRIDNFPIPSLEEKEIGRYLRAMHYVDAVIGEFLERLEEDHLRQKTMVVIYGDHRARLESEGLVRVGVNCPDENDKVPLIISCPALKPPRTVTAVGGLIDVTPTLCNLLGVETSHDYFLGKDLTRTKKGYVVFRNSSYISEKGMINQKTALEQLRVSDTIIERDLLREIRKPTSGDLHRPTSEVEKSADQPRRSILNHPG